MKRAWKSLGKPWSAVVNSLPDPWKSLIPLVWLFASLTLFMVQAVCYTIVYPIWLFLKERLISQMNPLSL